MKKLNLSVFLITSALILSILTLIPTSIGDPLITSRTYTFNSDFDEGTLVGVEHDTVPDQLQLSTEAFTLPFIWVPNLGEGTVSKVNTETGDEIGRYRVAPAALPVTTCSPSRTTVDNRGNCWVGVRDAGTVVKIGLYEAGVWIDHNGDSIIQTSRDINENGIIDPSEMLPFGQDECVLFEVLLREGFEGTYTPGTIPLGNYDINHWGTSPRGLAVDENNNLWAGTYLNCRYYYIDGETGLIDGSKTEHIWEDGWNHYAYGAVIDKQGILWSATRPMGSYRHLLRIDPSTTPASISKLNLPHYTYGLGLDFNNHLFVSGWSESRLSKIDVLSGTIMWSKSGPYNARGVACTEADNHVWVASTANDIVYRYDNDGNLQAGISVGDGPTGVAVDDAGMVWSCNLNDDYITRIDPADNSIFQKEIIGSGGHYSYSDMTGLISRTITTKLGTWTVDFDCGVEGIPWGTVSWNCDDPSGTLVSVKVRSSNDQSTWSIWLEATNGDPLTSILYGRYLQIESTLQIIEGEESPVLYDLTVEIGNRPPIADAGLDQTVEQTSHAGALISLDGSGSFDPDGDALDYEWTWAGCPVPPPSGVNPPPQIFPLGTTIVTLSVSDGFYVDTDTVEINVVDTTPPDIVFKDVQIELWPPNHKYHTIEIADFIDSVTDICDAGITVDDVIITSVSSDEPENDGGDGDTLEDIIIVNSQTVKLRSERLGGGNGRVYTINFKVTDASGNTATGSYEVWVLHDQEPGSIAINDGPSAGYTVFNLIGDWVLRFTFGGHYDHDMTIVSQELDGSFEGTGGYPSGGPYTHPWDVTGRTVGNFIEFTIIYTDAAPNPGYTVWAIGTLDFFGHMSGACDDSNSKHGTWESLSGPA